MSFYTYFNSIIMNLFDQFRLFKKVSNISLYFIFPLTFSLLVGWIVYYIRKCWRCYKEHKICEQTPLLHPLYSDVQYLSQQRKLYNLKTQITKYVLMIVCSSVEVVGILTTLLSNIIISDLPVISNSTEIQVGNLHCKTEGYDIYQFIIPIKNIPALQFTLISTLISILSRYLAARYLNHPFRRTLIKYIIWCSVQCLLTALCSTVYTWLLMVLVVPLIGLINWILLLRDTSLLSRVLRSNLREIQFHSNNRILYHNQLSAYKFYRIFRIVLIISMLFFFFSVSGYFAGLSRIILFDFCKIELHHSVIFPLFLRINNKEIIKYVILFVDDFFVLIYLILTCLPLCCITITPVIVRCVKRCREKEDQYRYNYEKLEPLIRKYL